MAPVRHRIATIRFTDLPLLAVLIVADKQARALVPRFLRMVPGFNDSDDELKRLAEFLVSESPDIPWHVTAFHKDYKMTDPENTTPQTLVRAAKIGKKAGLRYVYAGNLPGQVGDLEDTRCPTCQELLIERYGYLITGYHLTPHGCCPACGIPIPGRWDTAFPGQITSHPFVPRMQSNRLSILTS